MLCPSISREYDPTQHGSKRPVPGHQLDRRDTQRHEVQEVSETEAYDVVVGDGAQFAIGDDQQHHQHVE